jgi:thymidylate kinase
LPEFNCDAWWTSGESRPALLDGMVVVCDRFLDSSLAYQGFARGLGDADIFEINRWAVGGRLPDVVVVGGGGAGPGGGRCRFRPL